MGGSIYIFFELSIILLIITKSASKNIRLKNKIDLPVYIYIFTGLVCLIWSAANGNNTYDIFFKYRVVFLPAFLYLIVRSYLARYPHLIHRLNDSIMSVIALVAFTLIVEYIYGNILGYDKNNLIWVNYIQQVRVSFGSEALSQSGIRMISIFSYPHSASLLCSVGLFMNLLRNRTTRKKAYNILTFVFIAGLLLSGSRQAILSAFIGILYLSLFDKIIRTYLYYFLVIFTLISIYSFYVCL